MDLDLDRPPAAAALVSFAKAADLMSYKTIMVHAEPPPYSDERITAATQLAQAFDATLVGLAAQAYPAMISGDAVADAAMMVALRDRIDSDFPAAEKAFRQIAGRLARPTAWITAVDYPARELSRHAGGVDLIVASRPQRQAKPIFSADPVDLVMHAGCPVLFTPTNGGSFVGDRIVVGWKNTREARRALSDALPFMVRASEVFVVAVEHEEEASTCQAELKEVALRLSRHGVNAKTEVVATHGPGAAEDLERVASRHQADLIVVGAYGHSRMREWAMGGMTEDLLASSSKFVLFSH